MCCGNDVSFVVYDASKYVPHVQYGHYSIAQGRLLCKSVLFTELSHHVLVVVGASTCTRLCMLVT